MANELRRDVGATPSGGGRWDHETMRQAAESPLRGPASTDTLAASGGLELPAHRISEQRGPVASTTEEPIPGERDASTFTRREPGAMGGRFSGADTPPVDPAYLMDPATRHDRQLEGGGAD